MTKNLILVPFLLLFLTQAQTTSNLRTDPSVIPVSLTPLADARNAPEPLFPTVQIFPIQHQ
jgi:hypothetical protein